MVKTTDRQKGIMQATVSISSIAGLYYVWDLINDCKVSGSKLQVILFIIITLTLYLNINIWYAGMKDISNRHNTYEEGDFNSGSELVRKGIPYLTDNTKHEIDLAYDWNTGTNANNKSIFVTNGMKLGATPSDGAWVANPTLSEHERHFRHFIFCITLSAVVTGIFAVAANR